MPRISMTYNDGEIKAYPCNCIEHWVYDNCGDVICDETFGGCGVTHFFTDLGIKAIDVISAGGYDEDPENESDMEMCEWFKQCEAGGEMEYSYQKLRELEA